MSVTVRSPPGPAASPIMAKFFSSSQPTAPAPTCRGRAAAAPCALAGHSAASPGTAAPAPAYHQVLLAAQLLLEGGPEDSDLAIVARAPLPGQRSRMSAGGCGIPSTREGIGTCSHRGAVVLRQLCSPLQRQALQGIEVQPLVQGQELLGDGLGQKGPCQLSSLPSPAAQPGVPRQAARALSWSPNAAGQLCGA